jgi:flagellin-like hook-associated protein FlgL
MSGIVLSSSVRQNLLSLQSTADLLATTQNRLSTGKKVNTALDNPTNFFTAQSLDSRAGDINNLLDGIGNGVQVLQAANTGITSLQKLVDTAKSLANQALQTSVGYSTKSNVSATISGATAADLRGTNSYSASSANSNVLYTGAAGGATAAASGALIGGVGGSTAFGALLNNNTTQAAISASTVLAATSAVASNALAATVSATGLAGKSITVNGKTISFSATATPLAAAVPTGSGVTGNVVTDGSGNSTVYLGAGTTSTTTVGDVLNAIDLASGVKTTVNASGAATLSTASNTQASSVTSSGELAISSTGGGTTTISGANDILKFFGLTSATGSTTGTVTVGSATSSATTANLVQDGSTLNVNGRTITFSSAVPPAAAAVPAGSGVSGNIVTDGSGNSTVYLQGAAISDVLNAIDLATGVKTTTNTAGAASLATAQGATASSILTNGQLQISTGTAADLSITGTGNALSALGLGGNQGSATSFTATRTAVAGGVAGKTLSFTSFNGGAAVNVTFGDGSNGTVKTLDQLNASLQANNLSATLDSLGKLTISTTNDYASSTLGSLAAGGAIGGTLTSAISFTTASAPVIDPSAQTVRSNLVRQYNDILAQITTTSQDASFNGVNLLGGDQLKLTFNETGKSTLNITGVSFNAAGLGLANLQSGTDFIDNSATNKVIANLSSASTLLRTQASALGSNLSIVQIRQDFSKNLINVLQTGSSNLTLADTNEEAANSQALSTRQSIAVSALSLANQSQQSVLQLLR